MVWLRWACRVLAAGVFLAGCFLILAALRRAAPEETLFPFVRSERGALFAPGPLDEGRPASGGFTFEFVEAEEIQDPSDPDLIVLSHLGEERTYGLRPNMPVGAGLEVEGEHWYIVHVGRWEGIVRNERGAPMASVSIRLPYDDTPSWFALSSDDGWTIEDNRIALRFEWAASTDDAHGAILTRRPALEDARWGVVDGDATTWFDQFQPGMSAGLRNGDTVTLEGLRMSGPVPVLVASVASGAGDREIETQANAEDGLVRFEYPGACDTVIQIVASQEWEATIGVVARFGGAQFTVPAGEVAMVGGVEVELVEVLRAGSPVPEDRSPLMELVLQNGKRRVHVREGTVQRIGDTRLRYVPSDSRATRYHLRYYNERGSVRDVDLEPGDVFPFRVDGQDLELSHANVAPGHGLAVEASGALPLRAMGLGVALEFLGAAFIAGVRRL